MVRVLGFYLAGLLLFENFYDAVPPDSWIWIINLLLITSYVICLKRALRKWSGLFGLTAVVALSFTITKNFDESRRPDHLLNHKIKPELFLAEILEPPEKRNSGYRILIRVVKVHSNDSWKKLTTKAYCHFKIDPNLHHGDIVVIRQNLVPLKEKKQSDSFNYIKYLQRKNIFYNCYLTSQQIRLVGHKTDNLYHHAILIRKWVIDKIKFFVDGEKEKAIASALLVGQSEELDQELNRNYSITGTLHVLSVSGLHTGLLYWMILFLLKPLEKLKFGAGLITVITLFILWSYALITGLSPSVLRAVVMFSMITAAKPFGLKSTIWNTLASSAFLLILFDPWLITRIGFQLSYLAIAGIVWFHPKLMSLWEPKSYIAYHIWNLSSVSVSAQLATLPITLLHFHQLPIWFIPANLIIIPLSSLALAIGLIFIPFSGIPIIATILGWMLSKIILLMNIIIEIIGKWPVGSFNNVQITTAQSWLILIILIGFGQFFETKNKSWILLAAAAALIFGAIDAYG